MFRLKINYTGHTLNHPEIVIVIGIISLVIPHLDFFICFDEFGYLCIFCNSIFLLLYKILKR